MSEDSKSKVGGVKFDQDKIDFALMPILPMTEVAKVWTFGKKKYSAWNWTKGFSFSRPYAAALRHMFAWASGQNKDPETGISHLAHAICCLMMLLEFTEKGTGEDDRQIDPQYAEPDIANVVSSKSAEHVANEGDDCEVFINGKLKFKMNQETYLEFMEFNNTKKTRG